MKNLQKYEIKTNWGQVIIVEKKDAELWKFRKRCLVNIEKYNSKKQEPFQGKISLRISTNIDANARPGKAKGVGVIKRRILNGKDGK